MLAGEEGAEGTARLKPTEETFLDDIEESRISTKLLGYNIRDLLGLDLLEAMRNDYKEKDIQVVPKSQALSCMKPTRQLTRVKRVT